MPECRVCRYPGVVSVVDLLASRVKYRTKNCFTNPSIFLSICVFSLPETALGGVNKLRASSPFLSTPKIALFITQHQNGTVLLSASGMLFPLLVESTTTHPPCRPTTSSSCRFSLRRLNAHSPMWPSVLLKYTLEAFRSGEMYQLPQRSFATSGRSYAAATLVTNSLSFVMEVRRLVMDSAERLSEDRVLEKLGVFDRWGKMMSDSVRG